MSCNSYSKPYSIILLKQYASATIKNITPYFFSCFVLLFDHSTLFILRPLAVSKSFNLVDFSALSQGYSFLKRSEEYEECVIWPTWNNHNSALHSLYERGALGKYLFEVKNRSESGTFWTRIFGRVFSDGIIHHTFTISQFLENSIVIGFVSYARGTILQLQWCSC